MPEPIISPTISDRPFKYVKVLCFSNDPPPKPPLGLALEVGAPMGAYPSAPAVELKGNILAEKSKADDTEYDRFILLAGLALFKGSSRSSDSLRDDDMLGRDEISVAPSSLSWLELARDASSRESLVFEGRP
jgi:hypothetical protein